MLPSSEKSSTLRVLSILVLFLLGRCAYSQGSSLSLASGTALKGSALPLTLSLNAPSGAPASVQWTLAYSATGVAALGAVAGPALTAAGKTLSCNSGVGTLVCVASGLNATAMSSGVLATITATLSPNSGATVDSLPMSNVIGTLPNGTDANMTGTGGSINVLPAVSGLQCSPNSLTSGTSSTCTVTLSMAAPTGGTAVLISDNNACISVPASITVPATATSTTFQANAGTISSSQTVTITASFSGSSATAAISLVAPVSVSSLACNPASLGPNASTACTVTLTQPAPTGGASVALSNTNSSLTVPASVTVAASATTATFTATTAAIAANASATVTASYNNTSASSTVGLVAAVLVSSLACNPASLGPNASTTCTVIVSQPASTNGVIVTLSSNRSALTVPASVTVPASAASATFTASTAAVEGSQVATITAKLNGSSARTTISLKPSRKTTGESRSSGQVGTKQLAEVVAVPVGIGVTSVEGAADDASAPNDGTSSTPQALLSALKCAPNVVDAGNQLVCDLRLSAAAAASQIQVSSSSQQVKLPGTVVSRPNQTHLSFQLRADAASHQQLVTVTARLGETAVEDTILLMAASIPVINAPQWQFGKPGTALGFVVSATDPTGMPIQITASRLPLGAAFDSASGMFEWTPTATQIGKYNVTFVAANSADQSSSTTQVSIEVTSGTPTLASMDRPCSPAAVASVRGSALSEAGSSLSDPSGNALDLGGTKVKVNGEYVPVLGASSTEVRFLCPSLAAGTQLTVSLETQAGVSEPLNAVMQSASPWIFPLGGAVQGQAIASFPGTQELAMARNAQFAGHPAQPGETILFLGTGFEAFDGTFPETVSVQIGGVDAEVEGLSAVPGHGGVFTLQVRVPVPMAFGDEVPVEVRMTGPDGKVFRSSGVTIAIEPTVE